MNLPTLEQNRRTCRRCDHGQQKCGGACLCFRTGKDIRGHQWAGDCDLFPPPLPDAAPLPPPRPPPTLEETGRRLWAELHRFCLTGHARGPGKLAAQLAYTRTRLPCGACRQGLDTYVRETPPDEANPFGWSVGLHNYVNEKLSKPTMTVEQARARWAQSSDEVVGRGPLTAPDATPS